MTRENHVCGKLLKSWVNNFYAEIDKGNFEINFFYYRI